MIPVWVWCSSTLLILIYTLKPSFTSDARYDNRMYFRERNEFSYWIWKRVFARLSFNVCQLKVSPPCIRILHEQKRDIVFPLTHFKNLKLFDCLIGNTQHLPIKNACPNHSLPLNILASGLIYTLRDRSFISLTSAIWIKYLFFDKNLHLVQKEYTSNTNQ